MQWICCKMLHLKSIFYNELKQIENFEEKCVSAPFINLLESLYFQVKWLNFIFNQLK